MHDQSLCHYCLHSSMQLHLEKPLDSKRQHIAPRSAFFHTNPCYSTSSIVSSTKAGLQRAQLQFEVLSLGQAGSGAPLRNPIIHCPRSVKCKPACASPVQRRGELFILPQGEESNKPILSAVGSGVDESRSRGCWERGDHLCLSCRFCYLNHRMRKRERERNVMRAGLMHYSAVGRLKRNIETLGRFLTRQVCNHAHRAPRGNVITLVRNRERKREGRVGVEGHVNAGLSTKKCWRLLKWSGIYLSVVQSLAASDSLFTPVNVA